MAGIAALAIAYLFSQFYRAFLAVLTPALTQELGATTTDLSIASGAWFGAFALMQFVVGVWLDRYGPRRTASAMMAVAAGGGALLFAAAWSPWMVIAAMTLIGIGCSPVLMASFFIFARTFSPARFAVLASSLIAFGTAGNVVGSAPLALAVEAFGWRESLVVLAVLTFVSAAAVFLLVRDPRALEGDGEENTGFAGYLELLKIRTLWFMIPLITVHYAPAMGIRGLWAGPYLADVHGAGTIMIGDVTLWMALAMVAGSFAYGPLDTIFGTRKWVAVGGSAICMAALGWLALFPESTVLAATVCLIVIGLTGMGYGVLMAHARAFFPAVLTGRGVTLMNFFSIGGVASLQFVTGGVVEAAQVPGEPTAAYQSLFAFYALLLAVTISIYLFSRDAKPR